MRAAPERASTQVWAPWLRATHWALVAAVAVAWFSGEALLQLHELAGDAALALIAGRCIGGWLGGRHARFRQFVRSPAQVRRYAAEVLARRKKRYLGHNPLGGWMVVALLATVAVVGVTGWMYSLDMFWGLAWVEWLHRSLAWTLVALIALHLAGVAFTSWRHRENLVAAMFSGRKRPREPGDAD
ncbi:putative cytochrome B561 [Variovorax paradoxus B4]|uniref:Putative cytochrome B561 n=1 Tax=Variovorax paradoxus B4 TaxID=1246301 RepID=T1X7T5_VARPD|nr:cytochrome b/b6 domain-containing protein [Variovorax paradoxus]AGU49002.1 putative cytochrome B561 [Variovorax paradoxus B4]